MEREFVPELVKAMNPGHGHAIGRRMGQLLLAAVALLSWGCTLPRGTAPDQPSSLTIAAVGDTNGYNLLRGRPDSEDPLFGVRDLLRQQDVLIFNYEGAIVSKPPAPGTCQKFPRQSMFYSLPWVTDFLHPTQLVVATLANNHVLDCGPEGIEDTIREFSRRRIFTVGAGRNADDACKPVRLRVDGIRLAVVAYLAMEPDRFSAKSGRAGTASWEECGGERQLAELVAAGDFVVVALHLHVARGWKEETPTDNVDWVRRVLTAGADVVIGHGPHVPHGILVSDGRVGLLSLGNFLFRPDYRMPEPAHRSVLARLTISSDSLGVALMPLRLDDSGRPGIPRPEEATQILQGIATLSTALGTSVEIRGDLGHVTVQRRR